MDSGGQSLWSGLKNYVEDLVKNGGMPSQVDAKPFVVGKNLAATPGSVVFRSEVFELIQYRPVTPQVRRLASHHAAANQQVLFALDLSPDKEHNQFLLRQGVQVFAISCGIRPRSIAIVWH